MPHYDPASFFGPEAARSLAELAGEGRALEFAIGTEIMGRFQPLPSASGAANWTGYH